MFQSHHISHFVSLTAYWLLRLLLTRFMHWRWHDYALRIMKWIEQARRHICLEDWWWSTGEARWSCLEWYSPHASIPPLLQRQKWSIKAELIRGAVQCVCYWESWREDCDFAATGVKAHFVDYNQLFQFFSIGLQVRLLSLSVIAFFFFIYLHRPGSQPLIPCWLLVASYLKLATISSSTMQS